MEKINFINGQEPAINASNLNQIQENVEEIFSGTKSISINACDTLAKILSTLRANIGFLGYGIVGTLDSSNLKTLLGTPNIGNFVRAIARIIYDASDNGLIEIYAYAMYSNSVKKGYIIFDNLGIQWSGWN